MAAFTVASGLLEVASVGITLTKALHDLGTTAREAGEQTDFLSKNISHHCRALKSLSRQLKTENPDHSAEALDVARELQEQSNAVLAEIQKLIPSSKRMRDGLSLKQRLMWSLRRSRVKHLVGQLEYLKSTVTLLLHVLSTVPNLRKYRKSKSPSPQLREEISEELTEAQNLIYERCRAQQDLPDLAADDEADGIRTIEFASMLSPPHPNAIPDVRSSSPTPPYSLQDPAPHPGNCLAEIDDYANQLNRNDSRAMIMQKTTSWLAQLYGRWTTLPVGDSVDCASSDKTEVADLAAAATEDSNVSLASEETAASFNDPVKTKKLSVNEEPELERINDCTSCDGYGGTPLLVRCPHCRGWGARMDSNGQYVEVCPYCKGRCSIPGIWTACWQCSGLRRNEGFPQSEEPFAKWEKVFDSDDLCPEDIVTRTRWTKVSRRVIDPIALKIANQRFEEHDDYLIVMRILRRREINILAEKSLVIREALESIKETYHSTNSVRATEKMAIRVLDRVNGMSPGLRSLIIDDMLHDLQSLCTERLQDRSQGLHPATPNVDPPKAYVEDASSSDSTETGRRGSVASPRSNTKAHVVMSQPEPDEVFYGKRRRESLPRPRQRNFQGFIWGKPAVRTSQPEPEEFFYEKQQMEKEPIVHASRPKPKYVFDHKNDAITSVRDPEEEFFYEKKRRDLDARATPKEEFFYEKKRRDLDARATPKEEFFYEKKRRDLDARITPKVNDLQGGKGRDNRR